MAAIDGAKTEGKNEVINHAYPEVVGHAKGFGRHEEYFLKPEKRVWRQHKGPNLVEVGIGEPKGVEHGSDVGRRLSDGSGLGNGRLGRGSTGALPEAGFGVDIGEEGTGNLSQHGVEVGGNGLRKHTRTNAYLGNSAVGRCGFTE